MGIYPYSCVFKITRSPLRAGTGYGARRERMTAPHKSGCSSAIPASQHSSSNYESSTASPARVEGWRQEPRAHATHGVPPGYRQGGPWGSKT